MPNWCQNHLDIKSSNLAEVMETITEEGNISFNKFIPMPKELEGTTSPREEEDKELIKKYGADNWFDWRYMNWGVKWDASETEWVQPFEVMFKTPWGPALPVFIKLSKKFPDAEIKIQFADEFSGQFPLGQANIKNGKAEIFGPKEGSRKAQEIAEQIWSGEWAKIRKTKENTTVYGE